MSAKEDELGYPDAVKDLDLTREGFEQDVLKLPIEEFGRVLKRDDLKCRSEDHVLSLTLTYMEKAQQKIIEQTRVSLMPLIRLDLLSKDRLIELSTKWPDLIYGMEKKVIEALCAKL